MKLVTIVCVAILLLSGSACSRRKGTVQAAPVPVPAASVAPKRGPVVAPPASRPEPTKTVPAPQSAAPVLEPLTTPEERSTWSEEIQASLLEAERNAAALRSRSLPQAQQRDLDRVQSFIRQARKAESAHDYVTARSYAQRAEVLSRDLMTR